MDKTNYAKYKGSIKINKTNRVLIADIPLYRNKTIVVLEALFNDEKIFLSVVKGKEELISYDDGIKLLIANKAPKTVYAKLLKSK